MAKKKMKSKKTEEKVLKKKIVKQENEFGLSYEMKTLIVILLLVFTYPVGLVMMFLWMDWPKWVKALIALPVILGLLVLVFVLIRVPFRMMMWW